MHQSEIGLGDRALGLQRSVDLLSQRRVVAAGVGVPDFKIARAGRLAQRLHLSKAMSANAIVRSKSSTRPAIADYPQLQAGACGGRRSGASHWDGIRRI